MRISIEIDDELLLQAQQLTGTANTHQLIDQALRLLIQRYQQHEVCKLRGQLHWEGDLDEMRE